MPVQQKPLKSIMRTIHVFIASGVFICILLSGCAKVPGVESEYPSDVYNDMYQVTTDFVAELSHERFV